ncbi:MAG: protein kinase, partial [Myxococcales bacterium]|nr:protein kinase [Myxococcales bacterium]
MESRDETELERWEARGELPRGARDPALDDAENDDGATLSRPAVSAAASLSTALGEAATVLAAVDAPAPGGEAETLLVERRARSVRGEATTLLADEAVTLSAGDRAPPRPLDKGAQLGRYVVLRKLGAGAMGTIYLGYDPDLDRRVALKILRGATSAENRRALLREAQAMAKLTHPNVVSVHDVGEH